MKNIEVNVKAVWWEDVNWIYRVQDRAHYVLLSTWKWKVQVF
jgi:hypothetical protein